MAVPVSLPQRIYVLAYNPAKGRVGLDSNLGPMLRAAALADLCLRGHLVDERGRAVIAVRRPCHDPVLDALLDEIAGSKPRAWQSWISHGHRAARSAVRQQLGDGGRVRLEPHKVLGLFPTTRVTLRDPGVRTELLGRVDAALTEPIGGVDPADAALVAIVAAGDLTLVLDRRTRRAHKRRIQELTGLSGPIATALRTSIQVAAAGG
jgi:hypothetical protein